MKKIAFFDTKPYDRVWFDRLNKSYEVAYFESKLTEKTAALAAGSDAVCCFVNDEVGGGTVDALCRHGVRVLAMRSAGYNNVDVKAAYGKLTVVRVPAYSPHAVAEHAMALLMSLNRKIHRAYNRTRDFNFSLSGLVGTDLYSKTAGIIGTGKIGRVFIDICRGFGMEVVAYDPYPAQGAGLRYLPLDELFAVSDIISLHCPLTDSTRYIIDSDAIKRMKNGVYIINTSRGELIDTQALLEALNSEKVGGAGLDVYEEESDLFFEDFSGQIIQDEVLSLLVTKPNVLITSHQAFLTEEALMNIARTTYENLDSFFSGGLLENEVCYRCEKETDYARCQRNRRQRCF